MPLYSYKCHACKRTFDVRHGMFFENQRCIHCHSDEVFRLPSEFNFNEKNKNTSTGQRVGKVVDDYIKEAKKTLQEEKKDLTSREL